MTDARKPGDRLSSLVVSREAEVFLSFAEHVATMASALFFTDKEVSEIEKALRGALDDDGVSVSLKGSAAKSTQSTGSDIDIVVLTPGRKISREDKLAVVDSLSQHPLFHRSHVALKKLAIGCTVRGQEVDLVFHDTVEFGQLPVGRKLEDGFCDNPIAQHAARMLKFAVKKATSADKPETVPSFVIEVLLLFPLPVVRHILPPLTISPVFLQMLVLEAQRTHHASSPPSPTTTAMHLFLDALQLLVDSPDGAVLNDMQDRWFDATALSDHPDSHRVRGQNVSKVRQHSMCLYARNLLLFFCATRVYSRERFTTLRDVERWVRCMECGYEKDFVRTPLGFVPAWLVGHHCNMDGIIHYHSDELLALGVDWQCDDETPCRTMAQCLELVRARSADAMEFSKGPFAEYTRAPSGTCKSTSLRETAKVAFSQARYEDALLIYDVLVWQEPENMHLWFSNRSACFVQLKEYHRAARDAASSVKHAPPCWPKAHFRVLRACLDGKLKSVEMKKGVSIGTDVMVSAALHELQKMMDMEGILSAADVELFHSRKNEVAKLLERGPIARMDPSALTCWSKVAHQDSVIVVDSEGCGDFVALREALQAAYERNIATSVIVVSGTYALRWPTCARFGRLQIIGEGKVSLTSESSEPSIALVLAAGDSCINLSGLRLNASSNKAIESPGSNPHCVLATLHAKISLTDCHLRSSVASIAIGKCASATLLRCKALGPGGAILCESSAIVDAQDCQFSGSRVACVEVRSLSSCSLKSCVLENNDRQALSVYQSASAEITKCKISKCGAHQNSAVLLGEGALAIRECRILNNRHDGVVVQAATKDTKLDLQGTTISRNKGGGVCIFGGSATVSGCRIQENSGAGIFGNRNRDTSRVHGARGVGLGKVELTRNILKGNGNNDGVCFAGEVELSCHANDGGIGMLMDAHGESGLAGSIFKGISSGGPIDFNNLIPPMHENSCTFFDLMTGKTIQRSASPFSIDSKRERVRERERNIEAIRAQTSPLSISSSEIVAVHFQKKALIEMQLRNVERWQADARQFVLTTDNNVLPLPTRASSRKKLSPVYIDQLPKTLGRRAEGRILSGTLCAPPGRVKGVQLILADKRGLGVKLSLYNLPGVESPHWRECFPEGMQLKIKEPFLKRSADAQFIVRVDHAADVEYVTRVCSACSKAERPKNKLKKKCDIRMLMACAQCRHAFYCSRECQKADWKKHKRLCGTSTSKKKK
jgi:hypothetical protein